MWLSENPGLFKTALSKMAKHKIVSFILQLKISQALGMTTYLLQVVLDFQLQTARNVFAVDHRMKPGSHTGT